MKIIRFIKELMRPKPAAMPDWRVGDRVFIEPEEDGFPFGRGTITAIGPHWTHTNPKKWYSVLLDKPAQRHTSDSPPREWRIAESELLPA